MNAVRAITLATVAALAAGAGWFARDASVASAPAARPAEQGTDRRVSAAAPAPSSTAQARPVAPLIAVASDGNVTLRVEQQPLQWVLEQIAAQSGWTDVKERARAVKPAGAAPAAAGTPAVADAAGVACPEPAPRVDASRVLAAIERGAEEDRYNGLLQARSDGVQVGEQMLKTLFETDASERVRVEAFAEWLHSRADRPDTLREALQAALYVPSAAIQHEAKRRLDELNEAERIDALSGQRAP